MLPYDPYMFHKLRMYEEERLRTPRALHRAMWLRQQEEARLARRRLLAHWAGARLVRAGERLQTWAGAGEPPHTNPSVRASGAPGS